MTDGIAANISPNHPKNQADQAAAALQNSHAEALDATDTHKVTGASKVKATEKVLSEVVERTKDNVEKLDLSAIDMPLEIDDDHPKPIAVHQQAEDKMSDEMFAKHFTGKPLRDLLEQLPFKMTERTAMRQIMGTKAGLINFSVSVLTRTASSAIIDFPAVFNAIIDFVMDGVGDNVGMMLNFNFNLLVSMFQTIMLNATNTEEASQRAKEDLLAHARAHDSDLVYSLNVLFGQLESPEIHEALRQMRVNMPDNIRSVIHEILVERQQFQRPAQENAWIHQIHRPEEGIETFSKNGNHIHQIEVGAWAALLLYRRNVMAAAMFLTASGWFSPVLAADDVVESVKKEEGRIQTEVDIAIVTDSSAAFPKTYAFSQYIFMVETTDGVESEEFEKLYARLLQNGVKRIYSIHVSSKLSASYETALGVAEKLSPRRIKVFDSKAFSLGLGLLVQRVAEFIHGKRNYQQIERVLKESIKNERHWLVLNSLDHIEHRVGSGVLKENEAKHKADQFHFKPLLSVKEELEVIGAYLRVTAAIDQMIHEIETESKKQKSPIRRISIEYRGMYFQALQLLKQLKLKFKDVDIYIYPAGPFTSGLYGAELVGVSML